MAAVFIGILAADNAITLKSANGTSVQGLLLCTLIILLVIPVQIELKNLAAPKGLTIFTPLAAVSSAVLAASWYWLKFVHGPVHLYMVFMLMFILAAIFLYQYFRFKTVNTIANCSVNCFAILYAGLLSSFILGIRVDFGFWPFLMFIFTVKSSDIGAYTVGKLFGKHLFSPNISPKKTWEGMAGGIILSGITAFVFAVCRGIMVWQAAVGFAILLAFIGQIGDLAESMLKRDAEQKDSAKSLPGFGGILDVIDSPLAASPVAYLFFMCCQ